jgi:quercetin dioxygenase-like cupin family protein
MTTFAAAAAFALAAFSAVPPAGAQTPALDLAPGDVVWLDAPVPGVKTAVLSGSLIQPGLYILRVKIAKDAKLMPHTHPDVRYTTVLSGDMHFGFGEAFDASRMKVYPPGAIIAIPANAAHFVWARDGEVIVQDAGIGPTGTAPLKR